MEKEIRNTLIQRYLEDAESEFDCIVQAAETRHRTFVRRTALICAAAAAALALFFWIVPLRQAHCYELSPIQIAEGIEQMMLLDIGEIESIVATPADSYAILTAHLKDGSTCSYILRCNDKEGTTTLLAYIDNDNTTKK